MRTHIVMALLLTTFAAGSVFAETAPAPVTPTGAATTTTTTTTTKKKSSAKKTASKTGKTTTTK